MTPQKRFLDLALALCGLGLLAIPIALIAGLLLIGQGRPIFYVSERMKTPDQAFGLYKFRTMRRFVADSGVTGGDKAARITRAGRFLRRCRLDELPQLWNVLRGDISFVGPRPPLRIYVDRFPELYSAILNSRPGITGVATLYFHRREEALLGACRSPEDTDAVYQALCIPRKARLDLLYQRHQSIALDLRLLLSTLACVFTWRGSA